MADVRPYDTQQLLDTMITEGFGAATMGRKHAGLRRLFSQDHIEK